MITCDMQGGLGNIMFQVATTYALAKRNNGECYFDLSKSISCVTQHFNNLSQYKDNIFSNLPNNKVMNHNNHYSEPTFQYSPIPYNEDLFIHGYFQTEKYFCDFREDIIKLFEIPKTITSEIKMKYSNLYFSNSVSMHIRRGDYLKFQHIHKILPKQYYVEALKHFPNKEIIVFSDDMDWVKDNFKEYNLHFIEGEPDYIDMLLMSSCQHNIIANSSFSWWGAWLNQNPTKKVICPKEWFAKNVKHDIKDLYPKEWIMI